jgi:predicted DNA-binding protein (UPF0251 family)
MPRPPKSRKVICPPKMQGFSPFGIAISTSDPIVIQYDEFEAVRLLNYDGLSQTEAAASMEISQPTLTRIYKSALMKISQAFVEGNSFIIEGGNFEFEKDWYKCKVCFKLIDGIENHVRCSGCCRFGTEELEKLNK